MVMVMLTTDGSMLRYMSPHHCVQDFLQVVSMFSGFQFDWPPLLLDVYKWMSFTNFNLELVAPECNFHVRAIPAHACGRADHWWYSRSPLLR